MVEGMEMDKRRMLDILYGNRIDEMREYLEAGGNVDFSINGEMTPLCIARTVEMAELLLEKGADIHYRGYKNRTPLIWQANPGNPPVVELLLRTDPSIIRDVDDYGNTALHLCVHHAYEQSLQCAEILVAADPTLVTVRDRQGQTPLDVARQSSNVATKRIIDLLRKTAAGLKVEPFVTKHVIRKANKLRTLQEAWRAPENRLSQDEQGYNLLSRFNNGGNAYQALTSRYPVPNSPKLPPTPPSTPIGQRKRKTRKSKNRKNKSRRC
jgi:hypothetical protein